jgi:hypothetical protein
MERFEIRKDCRLTTPNDAEKIWCAWFQEYAQCVSVNVQFSPILPFSSDYKHSFRWNGLKFTRDVSFWFQLVLKKFGARSFKNAHCAHQWRKCNFSSRTRWNELFLMERVEIRNDCSLPSNPKLCWKNLVCLTSRIRTMRTRKSAIFANFSFAYYD